MFIMQASFEVARQFEDRMQAKYRKDREAIKEAEGNIAYECWRREHDTTVEYVFVSKWEQEADFKKWISRDAHKQEHREQIQRRRAGEDDGFSVKKVLHSFELFV
ncbi:heme-degrading monooxygenase HmoA [Thermosporothrix hazakensis]|uniref:Heme-degrading monooxygenase HmoA n=2 Tax=Thermosporothrix TaxID=768650 RepID=A0A326U966_THEHA|nr:antibiotic biosynthesis monooxygenase [Thermosporothrix hazakensis]PZW32560.1 heme-degrading monooxygenase HmoA [Thermosporothrix hazakensis]BBH87456.1 hypothetical protein KTC_22070 [Thermosporothrix sp. COM3]GCE49913.1 hypothetical protein KTH_47820 [Thermosporothrix hazakensis]